MWTVAGIVAIVALSVTVGTLLVRLGMEVAARRNLEERHASLAKETRERLDKLDTRLSVTERDASRTATLVDERTAKMTPAPRFPRVRTMPK